MGEADADAKARLRDTFIAHEAIWRLTHAIGDVAEATGPLLAWLRGYTRDGECRCCRQLVDHDPVMPCGQLQVRVAALGTTIRVVLDEIETMEAGQASKVDADG